MGIVGNTVAGAALGGSNAVLSNYIYDGDKRVLISMGVGSLAGLAGSLTDKYMALWLGKLLPSRIGGSVIDPGKSILLQDIGIANPYPGYIGWGTGQAVGGGVPMVLDGVSSEEKH